MSIDIVVVITTRSRGDIDSIIVGGSAGTASEIAGGGDIESIFINAISGGVGGNIFQIAGVVGGGPSAGYIRMKTAKRTCCSDANITVAGWINTSGV